MITSVSALCLAVFLSGPAQRLAPPAPETFDGKVLPTAKAMAQAGTKVGVKADAGGVALVAADGAVHPLVRDDTTRLLFLDDALHGRAVRLTARRVPGSPDLQVTAVRTLKGGVPHEVFYWCGQCQLRANEPGPCKCCGGETTLVEAPVKAK